MQNIIKTDNYLLIVSDEVIKDGDWIYNEEREPSILKCIGKGSLRGWAKIIAHIPLNNSPILEGVDLLPPLEDEVEKLSADYTEEWCGKRKVDVYIHDAFKGGYNKAKEKYKYTDEDLRNVIELARKFPYIKKGEIKFDTTEDEIIQSLQQPKYPIGFEMVMVDFEVDMGLGEECIQYGQYPKTTTNLEDQNVLVGKYIYA